MEINNINIVCVAPARLGLSSRMGMVVKMVMGGGRGGGGCWVGGFSWGGTGGDRGERMRGFYFGRGEGMRGFFRKRNRTVLYNS